MDLKLNIKCGFKPRHLTACQLQEIAEAICITLPDNMRLVYYGQKPPLDTTLSWQPTGCCDDPVGKVKNFKDGKWNE